MSAPRNSSSSKASSSTKTKAANARAADSRKRGAAKCAAGANEVQILSSRVAFKGPVFQVTVEDVIEPNGVRARRDTVRHSGSIVILALDEEGNGEPRVLLERQYRYPARREMLELPAGRIDPGEKELEAAKRELLEETGYTASHWQRILSFYVSPGFMEETMTIYLARGLKKGKAQPEADEVIHSRFFSLSAALKLAASGKILDAKTLIAVYWLARQTSQKPPQ
jgi:ADP-ribose pyrophosphatase